jgi:hypothetical protein
MALNQAQVDALMLRLTLAAQAGGKLTLTPAQVQWLNQHIDTASNDHPPRPFGPGFD